MQRIKFVIRNLPSGIEDENNFQIELFNRLSSFKKENFENFLQIYPQIKSLKVMTSGNKLATEEKTEQISFKKFILYLLLDAIIII